ncbi:hypothetical protein EDB83DRAFT_2202524, partial [Lactarius deliciosus]
PNNGTLHLGSQYRPFGISLFHQLRCSEPEGIMCDIIEALPKLSRHCLDYMRQMVFCFADLVVD